MKRTFTPGEEVRIKSDRFNRYRYVSRNIVRDIKTGRIKSVHVDQIRPASVDMKFAIQLIIAALLLIGIIKFAL